MKKILIVEDIQASREWMASAVGMIFPDSDCFSVDSCQCAIALCDQHAFDLALIDIGLPDGSGIDVLKHISAANTNCVCVVATIFDDDTHLFEALKAGAKGYILKEQDKENLLLMLQGIIDGKPPLSASIARRLLDFFSHTNSQQTVIKEKLTPRELQVLSLIGKGYTVPYVAKALEITANTAAGYVKNIYRKLDISSRAEAAAEAANLGLINKSTR